MRLFIAIEPDVYVKKILCGTREKLRREVSGRYVRDDQFHVTLLFLGEIEEGQVRSIVERMDDVAILHSPPTLEFGGYCMIRDILVMRVCGELGEVYKDLTDRMVELGVKRETRGYKPHITLVRATRGRPTQAIAPTARWSAGEMVLFQSVTRERLEYLPMHRAKFGRNL